MWIQVRDGLSNCLRRQVFRSLVHLALLTCACSSSSSGTQNDGTVLLNVTTPKSVKTVGATYMVANNQGEPVRFGTLTSELDPVELVLPRGLDYVLAVNALGRKRDTALSLECEGFRKFDVFRQEQALINLTLDCGELWPEEPAPEAPPASSACGIDAFVVGPLRQLVGAEIEVNVTAVPAETRFTWLTSEPALGQFTHPESDNVSRTSFLCEGPGETTLTLVAASDACSDEANMQVTCVMSGDLDAGDN